jgi:hypothetical protein
VKRGVSQSLHKRASTICKPRTKMRLVAWDVIFSSVVSPKFHQLSY